MIFSKTPWLLLSLLALAASPAWAEKSGRPVVIAASGTSYAEGSSPVTCLLDPACRGYWSPKSLDAGSNEGVYLRFQEPTLFNFIEITFAEALPDDRDLEIFLDAHSSRKLGVIKGDKRAGARDWIKTMEVERVYSGDGNEAVYRIGSSLFSGLDVGEQQYQGHQPLDYRGQSVFLKMTSTQAESPGQAAPKITAIRFFDQKEYPWPDETDGPAPAPLALELPVPMAAKATASSTLEPTFAYDVSKLFDSQPDMAWSTNGKKSKGIGETITVGFESEQEIHGLMLWNGYQRSQTHYRANARVKALRLAGQTVRVKDEQGAQVVRLPRPVKTAEAVLEILDIYPGGSYKDVLISELRFLGADDQVLLPVVPEAAPALPPDLEEVVDRTFSPILHESGQFEAGPGDCGEGCLYFDSTMRLRSNGSFVIYTSTWGEDRAGRSAVVEGNWEALPDGGLRLFGKKYNTSAWGVFSSYLKEDPKAPQGPAPRIFQSVMKAVRFASLPPAEQEQAVHYMLQTKWNHNYYEDGSAAVAAAADLDQLAGILMHAAGEMTILGGPDRETAVKNIVAGLIELNPLYVQSDVYTEILMPRHTLNYPQ